LKLINQKLNVKMLKNSEGIITKSKKNFSLNDIASLENTEIHLPIPKRRNKTKKKALKLTNSERMMESIIRYREQRPHTIRPFTENNGDTFLFSYDKMKDIDDSINKLTGSVSSTSNTLLQQIKDETWESRKQLSYMNEKDNSDVAAMKHIYNTVLGNEETFVKALDEAVQDNDLLNLRKKEVRFKKWQENIYIPIRNSIFSTFENDMNHLIQQKKKAYIDYLNFTNKNKGVFLDIKSDGYDPNAHDYKLKASIPHLNDPVHSAQKRLIHEDITVARCETGRILTKKELQENRYPVENCPLPIGRNNPPANPRSWLMMKYSNIGDPCVRRSLVYRKRFIYPIQLLSNLELAHQTFEVDKEEIGKQLGIPKRRRFISLMNKSDNIQKIFNENEGKRQLQTI